jgi:hypothetical protein
VRRGSSWKASFKPPIPKGEVRQERTSGEKPAAHVEGSVGTGFSCKGATCGMRGTIGGAGASVEPAASKEPTASTQCTPSWATQAWLRPCNCLGRLCTGQGSQVSSVRLSKRMGFVMACPFLLAACCCAPIFPDLQRAEADRRQSRNWLQARGQQ